MKKRLFAGFLAVLVFACTMLSCFAEGTDAALTVKNPVYNEEAKTISFVVANTTNQDLYFMLAGFSYDEAEVIPGEIKREMTAMAIAAGGEIT